MGTLGGNSSAATGINDSGEAVGYSYLADNATFHAFLWTQTGGMQDLNFPGGPNSVATAINVSGEVVGYYYPSANTNIFHAFLWTQTGGMKDLGTLGGTKSAAYAVSPSGQVYGWANVSPNESEAFIWTQSGGMRRLGSGPNSEALGVNGSGEVVGSSRIYPEIGFLWTPSKHSQTLNALIPPNSGWSLGYGWAVNRSGQIAASGNINGETHAALLTPTN